MAVLVCGIVQATNHELLFAESAAAFRLVRSGMLAAAVCDVADDAELSDEDAERYFNSLVGLLDRGPVLPVRFGTIAADDDAVSRDLLEAGEHELAERLEMLEGLVEVRLRIEVDALDEARKLIGASDPRLQRWRTRAGSRSFDERIEVGREISETLGALRDELSDRVSDRLGALAVAHAQLRPEDVTELRHAYLIRANQLSEFDDAVRLIRAELPPTCEVEYIGPLPPFEFTDIELIAPRSAHNRWGW